jgi:hypothetical protein
MRLDDLPRSARNYQHSEEVHMKTKNWLTLLAAVTFAFLSGKAEAQTRFVPVPSAAGVNWVGSFSNIPLVVNDATCTAASLNANSAAGPLQQNVEVDAPLNQAAIVFVMTSTVNTCGVTLQPINTGAFKLDVMGGNGNDVFYNFGLANARLFGQGGNDFLFNAGGAGTHGGTGNDSIKASGVSNTVLGWDGDDTVCSISSAISLAIGGNQDTPMPGDKLCGSATSQTQFESFASSCPF